MKKHHHHHRHHGPQALSSCKLLLWVLLMISACLVCSTSSQPAQRNDADDWQNDCTKACTCSWSLSRKVAKCRPVDRIPDTVSSEVQSLDLSDNGIVNIEDNAFEKVGLVHVQQLYLSKNLIRHIERLAFNGLKIVTFLDMSDNHLEHIDPSVFEPMTNLRELRLRGNPLQRFTGSPQMPALVNLESVDFSYCRLSSLPSELFNNLKKLKRIDLSGNSFQQLSVDVLKPLYQLNSLNLAANPFLCDCHLRDLHAFVMARLVAPKTTCASNSSSSPNGGKQFQDLTAKDFFCPPEIVLFRTHGQNLAPEDNHVRSVATGNDLTFDCQIEGDPMPELLWLKDDTLLFNTSGMDVKDEKYVVTTVESTMYKLSNMTIKSLAKEDSAIYTCQATSVAIGRIVRKGTELQIDSSVLVGGVSGGKSKSWLWILLGILGFLVLAAALVLIVLCLLRQRKRARKAQRVADINGDESTTTTKKKLYENRSGIGTMSSATAPLIEKSSHQGTIESNHRTPVAATYSPSKEQEAAASRRDFMDGGGGHIGPPMTSLMSTPLLSQYPHASVPSTPTFLPAHPNFFSPQPLPYHPGGWATYDPRRSHQHDAVSLSYRQPMMYGRLHSPFSGSVASFTSEPPRQGPVFAGPGYVTLPRRHRIPSWTQGTGGSGTKTPVPPSPTGSLPLVPNLRTRYYGHIGPRYDTIGPRTTVDGGSNLSLNKVGTGRDGARTPMTPSTPASAKIPLNRSLTPLTPSTGRIPKIHHPHHHQNQINPGTLFNFDPIEENDGPSTPTKTESSWSFPVTSQNHNMSNSINNAGPTSLEVPPPIPPLPVQEQQQQQRQLKQPPIPPAKPKRKSTNLDDEQSHEPPAESVSPEPPVAATFNNIQGTEV